MIQIYSGALLPAAWLKNNYRFSISKPALIFPLIGGLIVFISHVPIVLVTLSLPLLLWDYYSIPIVYFKHPYSDAIYEPFITWIYSLLGDSDFIYRPTYALYYHVLFLLFGGKFWAYYIIKWLLFYATVYLTYRILVKLSIHWTIRVICLAFLLFHPAHPVLMLFSGDLLVTFLALLILHVLITLAAHDARRSGLIYVMLWLLVLLASGAKEVSFLIIGILLIVFFLMQIIQNNARSTFTEKITLNYFVLTYGIPLLIVLFSGVFVIRVALFGVRDFSQNSSGLWGLISIFLDNFLKVFPLSPYYFITIFLGCAIVIALPFILFKAKKGVADSQRAAVFLSMLIGSLAVLLFVSYGQSQPAERYVIPASFFLAIASGLALDTLFHQFKLSLRFMPVMIMSLSLLLFIWNLGSIYEQTLAYDYYGTNVSDVINHSYDAHRTGKNIVVNTSAPEWNGNLRYLFSYWGKIHFGYPTFNPIDNNQLTEVNSKIIITNSVESGFDETSKILVSKVDDKLIKNLAICAQKAARIFGVHNNNRYDVGAPWLKSNGWLADEMRLKIVESNQPSGFNIMADHVMRNQIINPCDWLLSGGQHICVGLDKITLKGPTLISVPYRRLDSPYFLRMQVALSCQGVIAGVYEVGGKDLSISAAQQDKEIQLFFFDLTDRMQQKDIELFIFVPAVAKECIVGQAVLREKQVAFFSE